MLEQLKAKIAAIPRWRLYLYGGVAVAVGIYLLWCKFGTKPPNPGQTVNAIVAPAVANLPLKAVAPKHIIVYRDRDRAVEKLGIPPEQAPSSKEELFQANKVPKLPNGGTVVTFVNMSTGQGRAIVQAAPTPWFQFERGNAAGIKAEVSSREGQLYSAYYRRDFLQIKGAFIVGTLEANTRPEGKAGMAIEYRW